MQRLFEEGRWSEAQSEKDRIEDKQRNARRMREARYPTPTRGRQPEGCRRC